MNKSWLGCDGCALANAASDDISRKAPDAEIYTQCRVDLGALSAEVSLIGIYGGSSVANKRVTGECAAAKIKRLNPDPGVITQEEYAEIGVCSVRPPKTPSPASD